METIRKYVIFLNPGNDIVHNGIRLGTPEMLRADFPGAAIVPADEVPANWQEMSVQNGQLVAASAEVLAARRQAETARIQQEMGLTEQVVPGEMWLDSDGVTKKPVYCRTFTGTFNFATASNIVLANGIKSYEVVHSSILAGAGDSIIDNKVTDEGYMAPGTNTSWTIQNRLEINICQLAIVGQALLNKDLRYVVTLKYIKI